MLTISELSKTIGTYLQPEQVNKVQLAYQFSAEAHEGQKRKSGEPYICLLYTSPSPRDLSTSRMPSSA